MGFQYCWRSWKHVALYRPPVACIHLTKALFSCWNTSMWFKWVVVCPSCSNTAGFSVHPPPASHQPDAIATPHKITFFTLERIGPFLAAVCARLCGDKGTPSYHISPDSTSPNISRLCHSLSALLATPLLSFHFCSPLPVTAFRPQDKLECLFSFLHCSFKVNYILICQFSIHLVLFSYPSRFHPFHVHAVALLQKLLLSCSSTLLIFYFLFFKSRTNVWTLSSPSSKNNTAYLFSAT